jgi:type IV pilus assembly protein PilC
MVLFSVLGFYQIYLLPKFQKIFVDFGMELPQLTRRLFRFMDVLATDAWFLVLLVPALIGLAAVLLSSATVCWFFPGVGFVYRNYVRGRVLGALGVLLDADKPAPAALALLADTGAFSGAVERRIDRSRHAIEEGAPLADALRRSGLINASMGPLLRAAERAQNLSWALSELGDAALRRTIRLMRRISQALFPMAVVAIGLLVGLVVVAMFMPLLAIMGELAR